MNGSGSISLRKAREKRASTIKELKASTYYSLVAESIKHVEEDAEHMMTAEALRKLGQVREAAMQCEGLLTWGRASVVCVVTCLLHGYRRSSRSRSE